jgi:hypothetical protein
MEFFIGSRTCDLPACSIVPQPTTLLHASGKTTVIQLLQVTFLCILVVSIMLHCSAVGRRACLRSVKPALSVEMFIQIFNSAEGLELLVGGYI